MSVITKIIENNFSLLLLLGFVAGFFLPGFGDFSDNIIIVLIGFLVYFACPDLKREDLLKVDIFQVGIFTILRFAVFPLLVFYGANAFVPQYAEGILLLALMPAAIAIASLCSISGGLVALGLGLTVISSLVAPAFVVSTFSFLGQLVEVNIWGLFATLVLVIFVPIIIYFGVSVRIPPLKSWVEKQGKSSLIIVMAFTLFVVVSSYKQEFLDDIDHLLEAFLIMMGAFFAFYLFGVLFSFTVPENQRSTYIFASGATNNSLAIGLSFLYFSPQTTFFVVLSEVVWCIYVAAAQWYFTRQKH